MIKRDTKSSAIKGANLFQDTFWEKRSVSNEYGPIILQIIVCFIKKKEILQKKKHFGRSMATRQTPWQPVLRQRNLTNR